MLLGLFLFQLKKISIKKSDVFLSVFFPVADIIIRIFPNNFFGSEETLNHKMRVLHGEKDFRMLIKQKRRKTAASFYVICLLFSLLFLIASAQQILSEKELASIQRFEAGNGSQVIHADMVMRKDETLYQKSVKLNIKEKKRTKEEIQLKLEATRERIHQSILGDNTDLQHVYKPLNLYAYDALTNVKVQWYSDNSDIIDTDGVVNSLNIHQPVEAVLRAELVFDENVEDINISLRVVPFFQYASAEEKMHVRMEQLLRHLASESEEATVVLPDQVDGIDIQWLKPQQNMNGVIIISLLLLLFFLITTQYNGLDKDIKKKKEEIERDFPEFINQLVLLLNAGLIVESAIEVIVVDYKRYGKEKPLYEELSMVIRNVHESNASLIDELRNFAQRSGVKEVMRWVSIVRENIHLGSSLAQKLEIEATQSWEKRKQKAEVLGRVAETKLTFPLVLLLLVLIIIILAPAFMEM